YELLSLLAGQAEATGYEIVQGYWKTQHSGGDFDSFWRKSVHDGWIEGTAFEPKQVTLKNVAVGLQAAATPGIEINFRRDPSIYDGRFAKDRKSTRLNSSHVAISYAVFCLKKKNYSESRYVT